MVTLMKDEIFTIPMNLELDIAIVGAGTLSRLISDIVEVLPHMHIIGLYDDRYPELTDVCDIPVLGKVEDVSMKIASNLILGIGAPRVRKKFFEDKITRGFTFPTLIHPSCVISSAAIIDSGVMIGPMSTVLSGSRIERGACLLSCVNINQDVHIGPFALIGAGTHFGNGASVGEGSHIGMGAVLKINQRVDAWHDVP